MKKVNLLLALVSLVLLTNVAQARNVWRECGIGGMIFKKTGWAAITSNIIWDLGSTATSSNASSDDLCEGSAASTGKFIHESYATLEEETVVGEGQHLTAMLNMLGCEKSAHAGIISDVQAKFQVQMNDPQYSSNGVTKNSENYFNNVVGQVSTNYSSQCNLI